MSGTLIQNAQIVNEGRVVAGDLRIRRGRIDAIAGSLAARPGEVVVDAAGRWLLPGLIDDQVHFRQPGMTHKADIFTESRAAAAGGITSYMEMPNVNPTTTTAARVAEKCGIAARDSLTNYAFYLGAATDNLEDIKTIDPTTIAGVKIFMGSSTGNLLVDDEARLETIFQHAPTIIATHCESNARVSTRLEAARREYGEDIPPHAHATIRDAEACYASSSQAVRLAKQTGARLHVLHITTARELALFEAGWRADKRITAEACVHHLLFTDADYDAFGMLLKCNPAVKTAADRDAVRAAVADGRIDVLATDHAPHLLAEKLQPYAAAAAGLPLAEYALPAFLELVADGVLPITTLVAAGAHRVAELFAVDARGFIREGYWADLVLVDATPPPPRKLLSKCQWSPFVSESWRAAAQKQGTPLAKNCGRVLRHSVWKTFVNGNCVWADNQLQDAPPARPLVFAR